MSAINNVGGNSPVYTVNKAAAKPAAAPPGAADSARPGRGADRLELSGASQFLSSLKAGGDVRTEMIADIRNRIAAGKYEDEAKLDLATERMLDDLLK